MIKSGVTRLMTLGLFVSTAVNGTNFIYKTAGMQQRDPIIQETYTISPEKFNFQNKKEENKIDRKSSERKQKQYNPGHMAFRVSEYFANAHSNLTLKLLLNEIEEMRINDVTVRQKTDSAKLTALISNLGIFSVDMEKADAKV